MANSGSDFGRWEGENSVRGTDAGDSNLTRYVNNNPTNLTDPSGLQPPGMMIQKLDYQVTVYAMKLPVASDLIVLDGKTTKKPLTEGVYRAKTGEPDVLIKYEFNVPVQTR